MQAFLFWKSDVMTVFIPILVKDLLFLRIIYIS
jgi:hypothetical protein